MGGRFTDNPGEDRGGGLPLFAMLSDLLLGLECFLLPGVPMPPELPDPGFVTCTELNFFATSVSTVPWKCLLALNDRESLNLSVGGALSMVSPDVSLASALPPDPADPKEPPLFGLLITL